MPTIDLVDETYLRVQVGRVAAVIHDRARWSRWWPKLHPAVFMDRGEAGIRWNITGALVGSMEIWLEVYEPPLDGVLLHYYLRADPTASGSETEPVQLTGRAARRHSVRWARSSKQDLWNLKDELEADLR
ncbi:hypothetical protein BH24ACT9_BH24ACT9_07300 [soil metagenome]